MISVYVAIKSKKLSDEFCSSIDKSDFAKVTDVFYTLKDCREKLAVHRTPHILFLGLDLQDGYWIDFCKEIREKYPDLKILAITSYDEYCVFKNSLNHLTSGYISKDAFPKVIVSAINAIMEGNFFRYDKIVVPTGSEGPDLEWLQIQQMVKKIESNDNHQEMIDKLSSVIDATEKLRRKMIKNLLADKKDDLEPDCVDKYLKLIVENLLFMGHPNWDIADMLNVSIETVRLYRMDFILRLSGQHSMIMAVKNDGDSIRLGRREQQMLRLIAAGFTNQDIAENILYKDIETIKSERKSLIQKFGTKNTMTMVISALRMGFLKLEDIDELTA